MTDKIKTSDRKYLSEKYEKLDSREYLSRDRVSEMVDDMLDELKEYEFGVSYSTRMKENDEAMYAEEVNNLGDSLSQDNFIVEDYNDDDESLIEWRKDNLD